MMRNTYRSATVSEERRLPFLLAELGVHAHTDYRDTGDRGESIYNARVRREGYAAWQKLEDITYTVGSAITDEPTTADVVHGLMVDASLLDEEPETFVEGLHASELVETIQLVQRRDGALRAVLGKHYDAVREASMMWEGRNPDPEEILDVLTPDRRLVELTIDLETSGGEATDALSFTLEHAEDEVCDALGEALWHVVRERTGVELIVEIGLGYALRDLAKRTAGR